MPVVYRLFQYPGSGNCYKIQLLLELLGLPYETVTVDILAGESRTPAFLARNPAGKVPVLQLADDDFLPESNAALWYLAEDTDYLPADRRERAEAMRWLCFEPYSHEPNVATARFWIRNLGNPPEYADRLREKQEAGRRALQIMDDHLACNDFFVGGRYSIADIALYAYTHVAEEACLDLAVYQAVRHWLARVADQPGHRPMEY